MTSPAETDLRAPAPPGMTLHRRLSPRQQERRERIVAAALALASEGGYDGVAMKEVAARAGVSLGTLYRYFTSKDHLLADGLLAWGGRLRTRLAARPPRGATAAVRVGSVFRRMARGVAEEPQLGVALTRALLSLDRSALAGIDALSAMMAEWLDLALAEEAIPDRDGVVRVLQRVCFSCMIELANGSRSAQSVGDELERTAALLLER